MGSTNHIFRVCGTSFDAVQKFVLVYTCTGIVLQMANGATTYTLTTTDEVIKAGLAPPPENTTHYSTDSAAVAAALPSTAETSADANTTATQQGGRRLLAASTSMPPCPGCLRWTTVLCSGQMCLTCTLLRTCKLTVKVEPVMSTDMISSSSLIYRPDILANSNVQY